MTSQLLFYTKAVPLRSNEHRDLYVKSGSDYSFARDTNSVPLTVAEFPAAAAEYAILFAGNDEAVFPVVLLGTKKGQNLFVNDDGGWKGHYLPAFIRRYPFVFTQDREAKNLILCIDEEFAGCNREGRGERLFDAEGERTSYLQQVLSFQQAYQVQHQRTQEFCKKLLELELLQPVQATLKDSRGVGHVLTGLRVLNRKKLKELDAETVMAMLRSDELELIYLHLHSIANFRGIGERVAKSDEEHTGIVEGEAVSGEERPALAS